MNPPAEPTPGLVLFAPQERPDRDSPATYYSWISVHDLATQLERFAVRLECWARHRTLDDVLYMHVRANRSDSDPSDVALNTLGYLISNCSLRISSPLRLKMKLDSYPDEIGAHVWHLKPAAATTAQWVPYTYCPLEPTKLRVTSALIYFLRRYCLTHALLLVGPLVDEHQSVEQHEAPQPTSIAAFEDHFSELGGATPGVNRFALCRCQPCAENYSILHFNTGHGAGAPSSPMVVYFHLHQGSKRRFALRSAEAARLYGDPNLRITVLRIPFVDDDALKATRSKIEGIEHGLLATGILRDQLALIVAFYSLDEGELHLLSPQNIGYTGSSPNGGMVGSLAALLQKACHEGLAWLAVRHQGMPVGDEVEIVEFLTTSDGQSHLTEAPASHSTHSTPPPGKSSQARDSCTTAPTTARARGVTPYKRRYA